jgi:hypothetical protein
MSQGQSRLRRAAHLLKKPIFTEGVGENFIFPKDDANYGRQGRYGV